MRSLFTRMTWAAAAASGLLLTTAVRAQVQPAIAYQGAGQGQMPGMPASPLAGGAAAMSGDGYVNVHGQSIVMPAQYACETGYGGGCGYGDACGGYGDGMLADFGGYGAAQCGPHYFDLAFDAVTLTDQDRFEDVGPFGSVGAGGNAPRVLDPQTASENYEVGWQGTLRVDFGPLSVLEASYMGLYDIGFDQTVRSVDVTNPATDFQLFSAFSNFGVGTLIPALDDGSVYTIRNNADLQSTEFSYRRYWVGNRPRITGTYLLGFRYLRYTDDFIFQSSGLTNPTTVGTVTRSWGAENDLLGFQLGGDVSICLRQGLRLNIDSKSGIYNNRYQFTHIGDFADGATGSPADFAVTTEDDQVSYAGEIKAELVFDILPSFSLRGGYRALYMSSLVTPGDNLVTSDITSTQVVTQSDVVYHGFHGGVEYVW